MEFASLNFYNYKCEIIRIVDGDTVVVDIDLGCGVWMRGEHCRLYGIDAPEKRGETRLKGFEAGMHQHVLIERYRKSPGIFIETYKDERGKFGRFLVDLKVKPEQGDVFSINETMVKDGYAIHYGEKK